MIEIYIITNVLNNKKYVGKTNHGYLNRFHEHCLSYKHGERTYISCAIHKHGKDNFRVDLIDCVPDDDWKYWERHYILKYDTHYTCNGYNITWGGDSNPMDIPEAVLKHRKVCQSREFREKQRRLSLGRKHSEKTKELCRKNTLERLEECIKGFRQYNESKKQPVGIIENEIIKHRFESASEACNFIDQPGKEAGNLLANADKFTLKGTRRKFYGYSWVKL